MFTRKALKQMDLYRKVPSELTETSLTGATVSFVAIIFIVVLFCLELSSYLTPKISSSIIMDEEQSSDLQINFNLTFHRLSCQFASVDIYNVMGVHQHNVTRNIRKFTVNSSRKDVKREMKDISDIPQFAVLSNEDVAKYTAADNSEAVTTMNRFKEIVTSNKVVLANFYAPWCYWSNKLKPTWEQLAESVRDTNWNAKIIKIDCTNPTAHSELCAPNHINAFPSVISYENGATHSHEHYHGDRTTAAFMKHLQDVQVKMGYEVIKDSHRNLLNAAEAMKKSFEVGGDVKAAPSAAAPSEAVITAGPEGCNIVGKIMAKRVPGNFHVSALYEEGYSFDVKKLNLSHSIHHYSFGSPIDSDTLAIVPPEFLSANRLDSKTYDVTLESGTIEHYIKVVATNFLPLSGEKVATSYKYTANTNEFSEAEGAIPEARFTYDISPMAVQLKEESMPLYHFITNVCAIIGGLFTVLGLFDAAIYHGMTSYQQKVELGKAS